MQAPPFSARTGWKRRPNRLARRLAERRRRGTALLDLTETNPTRVGLTVPADLLAALGDPAGHSYDPHPMGLPAARRAVADDYGRRGAGLAPDDVVLTASTSEAYSWLLKLLCDPGDAVLVPRPSYPLFDYLAGLEAVRLERYDLAFDGAWHLDLRAVEGALVEGTRAVIAVSPNNPTGSWLRTGEAAALARLCAERGLALICDEVFADFPLEAPPDRLETIAAGGPALAFALGGLSKSLGLPQAKLAWIAASGPEPLRREALARLELCADTYLSVSTAVQLAAPRLLARRAELAGPIAARLRENLGALRALVGDDSPATLLPVEGGWTAVLRVPATRDEEERALGLLERDGVVVHPGYFFDFPSEAYLALSLLTPPDRLREGLGRILEDL